MPHTELPFPTALFHLRMGPRLILSEILAWPEVSRVGATRGQVTRRLHRNFQKEMPKYPPGRYGMMHMAAEGRTFWLDLKLDPPTRSTLWTEPVSLRFPVVVRPHGEHHLVVRVPTLELTFVAENERILQERLPMEVESLLRRTDRTASLKSLVFVQLARKAKLEWATVPVDLPSLKLRAVRDKERQESEQPKVLDTTAIDLTKQTQEPAYRVDTVLQQLAEALGADQPRSVLLVGPSGAGKSAVVRELVRRRGDFRLGSTPFYQTSGSRLVAGQCGYGAWQERCRGLIREASRKRAVVHLGNLIELMEVGKHEFNNTGLAGFLRPAIARGELLCIAECTPEQIPVIEKEDPRLIEAFQTVTVEEPTPEEARAILAETAAVPDRRRAGVSMAAVETVDRLHRRYSTYSAMPGRPIRFLGNLRRDLGSDRTVTELDVAVAFARETGLPSVLLDPQERLDVKAVRRWFGDRVIAQSEAVDLVLDVLATIKAGLTRPRRPLASLLFIGPTGVGKTETAKALAEFLFGSADRLTRFDMSEYGDPVAVQRLAGGIFGTEGLLTAKVREQPFSVLLFDEFEKAHPAFFDLMLQVLGEARLTDAGGRLADFRNCVIIMTSNLGAEGFQAGRAGFIGTADRSDRTMQSVARDHFIRELEKFLRPEMFNRIDRVIPFAPLDRPAVEAIARREWELVLNRTGIRGRGIKITMDPAVLTHLAETGYDGRYGARPLKRSMERELLAPTAHQINRYSADTALAIRMVLAGGKIDIETKSIVDDSGKIRHSRNLDDPQSTAAEQCGRFRRLHDLLDRSSTVRDLRNDVARLADQERRILRKRKKTTALNATEQQVMAKLGRLRELLDDADSARAEARDVETAALTAYHSGKPMPVDIPLRSTAVAKDWTDLLVALHRYANPGSKSGYLTLFSADLVNMVRLVQAYVKVCRLHAISVRLTAYQLHPPGDSERAADPLRDESVQSADRLQMWKYMRLYQRADPAAPWQESCFRRRVELDDLRRGALYRLIGVGLEVSGETAALRLARETGNHTFHSPTAEGQQVTTIYAEFSSESAAGYFPPTSIHRQDGQPHGNPLRVYNTELNRVIDLATAEIISTENLTTALDRLTTLKMQSTLEELVLQ